MMLQLEQAMTDDWTKVRIGKPESCGNATQSNSGEKKYARKVSNRARRRAWKQYGVCITGRCTRGWIW